MKTFIDLPKELISFISEYLAVKSDILSLSLSCKYFFEASIPTLWARLLLDAAEWESFRKTFSKPKKLYVDYRIFIKSFYITVSPTIHQWKSHSSEVAKLQHLRVFLAACPNLSTLVLESASLNDDDLWIVCKSCPNLNRLYLTTSATTNHGKITDDGLKIIAKSLIHLQHLVLKSSSPNLFTDRGLEHLKSLKTKLLTFGLEMEKKENASPPNFDTALGSPASMTASLSLSPMMEGFVDEAKFIDAYCSLLQHHNILENILLDWPVDMSSIFLYMANSVPFLKKLKTGNTSCLVELSAVLKAHPGIKYISLYEVHNVDAGPEDVHAILSPLFAEMENKTLTFLEFVGVCQFQSISPLIPFFKNLQSLIYQPSTRFASVLPALSTSTDLIAQSCRNLRVVAIPIHSNENLICFALNCPLLEDLDIQDGRGVDSAGLTMLATRCTKLRRLCLGSSVFNDVSADIFARNLGSSLRVLNLPSPSKLTSAGFIMLATGCPRIERLGNLSPYIPLEVLLQNLPIMTNLQELEFGVLRGRSPFSRSELDDIKAAGKRLKVISFH